MVYVNGIRGKSTVTRMIDGGLRAGGWKVFCKTTGTVPMVIGVDGTARPLVRRGRANISEQVRVLHRAVREGAQILSLIHICFPPCGATEKEQFAMKYYFVIREEDVYKRQGLGWGRTGGSVPRTLRPCRRPAGLFCPQ